MKVSWKNFSFGICLNNDTDEIDIDACFVCQFKKPNLEFGIALYDDSYQHSAKIIISKIKDLINNNISEYTLSSDSGDIAITFTKNNPPGVDIHIKYKEKCQLDENYGWSTLTEVVIKKIPNSIILQACR